MTSSTSLLGSSTAIAGEELREAMRAWRTGVTIVTSMDDQGRKIGLVSNSFTSVSLEPPLVSWCVDKGSSSFHAWSRASSFSIHILDGDQPHWVNRFAARGVDKFSGLTTEVSRLSTPVLDVPGTRLDCRVERFIDAGDHLMLFGEVHHIQQN